MKTLGMIGGTTWHSTIDYCRVVNELVAARLGGLHSARTREAYLTIIARLVARGAQGIILGCTEIPMLVKATDCATPLFDTTRSHATAAVDFALGA